MHYLLSGIPINLHVQIQFSSHIQMKIFFSNFIEIFTSLRRPGHQLHQISNLFQNVSNQLQTIVHNKIQDMCTTSNMEKSTTTNQPIPWNKTLFQIRHHYIIILGIIHSNSKYLMFNVPLSKKHKHFIQYTFTIKGYVNALKPKDSFVQFPSNIYKVGGDANVVL